MFIGVFVLDVEEDVFGLEAFGEAFDDSAVEIARVGILADDFGALGAGLDEGVVADVAAAVAAAVGFIEALKGTGDSVDLVGDDRDGWDVAGHLVECVWANALGKSIKAVKPRAERIPSPRLRFGDSVLSEDLQSESAESSRGIYDVKNELAADLDIERKILAVRHPITSDFC